MSKVYSRLYKRHLEISQIRHLFLLTIDFFSRKCNALLARFIIHPRIMLVTS